MTKNERRMLWMGKWAYPAIDTKRTKIYYIPPNTSSYRFPVIEEIADWLTHLSDVSDPVQIDVIDLKKWAYKGRRRRCMVAIAYYDKRDILLVREGSFYYEEDGLCLTC